MKSIFSCLTFATPAPVNTEISEPKPNPSYSRLPALLRLRSKIHLPLKRWPSRCSLEDVESATPECEEWNNTTTPFSVTPSRTPRGFKHWIPQEDHEFPFRIDDEASLKDPDHDCVFPTTVFDEGEMLDETLVAHEVDELRWACLHGELAEGVDFPQNLVDGFIPNPKPTHLNTYLFCESSTSDDDDFHFTCAYDADEDADEDDDEKQQETPAEEVDIEKKTFVAVGCNNNSNDMFGSPYDGDHDWTTSEDEDDDDVLFALSELSSLSEYDSVFDGDDRECLTTGLMGQPTGDVYDMIVEQRL